MQLGTYKNNPIWSRWKWTEIVIDSEGVNLHNLDSIWNAKKHIFDELFEESVEAGNIFIARIIHRGSHPTWAIIHMGKNDQTY